MWDPVRVKTTRDQVDRATARIDELKARIADLSSVRDEMRNRMQVNCEHFFAPPYKGHEHEGGVCLYCGIGELYAPTLRATHSHLIEPLCTPVDKQLAQQYIRMSSNKS